MATNNKNHYQQKKTLIIIPTKHSTATNKNCCYHWQAKLLSAPGTVATETKNYFIFFHWEKMRSKDDNENNCDGIPSGVVFLRWSKI